MGRLGTLTLRLLADGYGFCCVGWGVRLCLFVVAGGDGWVFVCLSVVVVVVVALGGIGNHIFTCISMHTHHTTCINTHTPSLHCPRNNTLPHTLAQNISNLVRDCASDTYTSLLGGTAQQLAASLGNSSTSSVAGFNGTFNCTDVVLLRNDSTDAMNTQLFCGFGAVWWVWCGCGVGVVWVWCVVFEGEEGCCATVVYGDG